VLLPKPSPQVEFGRVFGQIRDRDALHLALWKSLAQSAQVDLETSDHDRIEIARPHFDTARKPLGVKHFQERRETVGMAVMRCRCEK